MIYSHSPLVLGFVALALLGGAPAEAKPTPAAKCLSAKFTAAAKKTNAQLACEAKAASKQLPVDPQCLEKAATAFAKAFTKAESKGGCTTTGDASPIEASIDAFVQSTAAALPDGGTKDGGKCAAAKRKAAGKKASAKLLCNAKAAKTGGSADPGCLDKAEMSFATAFMKAEAKGGCVTTGDADAIEQATDGLVAQVGSQLAGGGTTTTSTTSTTTTTAPSPVTVTVVVGPDDDLRFDPASIAIHVGDSVRWRWDSGGHSVVSGTPGNADGRFCSTDDLGCGTTPASNAGTTYEHTFRDVGTFPYFCNQHGAAMTGQVVVEP